VDFHRLRCRARLLPLTNSVAAADGTDGKLNDQAAKADDRLCMR